MYRNNSIDIENAGALNPCSKLELNIGHSCIKKICDKKVLMLLPSQIK